MQDISHEVSVTNESCNVVSGDRYFTEIFCICQGKFLNFLQGIFTEDDLYQLLNRRGIIKVEADDPSAQPCTLIKNCDRDGGCVCKKPGLLKVVGINVL